MTVIDVKLGKAKARVSDAKRQEYPQWSWDGARGPQGSTGVHSGAGMGPGLGLGRG